MTERLADITARIDGVHKLGSVVNAMRSIAAARARQAHSQVAAVDSYAATIRDAMGRLLPLLAEQPAAPSRRAPRRSLVVFVAEQGFAGAFSEKVLDTIGDFHEGRDIFLVGTRGAMLARERGIAPRRQSAMPAHSSVIPRLADGIAQAVYERAARNEFDVLDVVFSLSEGQGGPVSVQRRRLLPFDLASVPRGSALNPPLIQLPAQELLAHLTGDYLHAQLCHAALHAFAAENQARLDAMASTRNQIDRMLSDLQATRRIVRQEAITAEIVELAAGEQASRKAAGRR